MNPTEPIGGPRPIVGATNRPLRRTGRKQKRIFVELVSRGFLPNFKKTQAAEKDTASSAKLTRIHPQGSRGSFCLDSDAFERLHTNANKHQAPNSTRCQLLRLFYGIHRTIYNS